MDLSCSGSSHRRQPQRRSGGGLMHNQYARTPGPGAAPVPRHGPGKPAAGLAAAGYPFLRRRSGHQQCFQRQSGAPASAAGPAGQPRQPPCLGIQPAPPPRNTAAAVPPQIHQHQPPQPLPQLGQQQQQWGSQLMSCRSQRGSQCCPPLHPGQQVGCAWRRSTAGWRCRRSCSGPAGRASCAPCGLPAQRLSWRPGPPCGAGHKWQEVGG